jgi:hypothetical protein
MQLALDHLFTAQYELRLIPAHPAAGSARQHKARYGKKTTSPGHIPQPRLVALLLAPLEASHQKSALAPNVALDP